MRVQGKKIYDYKKHVKRVRVTPLARVVCCDYRCLTTQRSPRRPTQIRCYKKESFVDLDVSTHNLRVRGNVKILFFDYDAMSKDDKVRRLGCCSPPFTTALTTRMGPPPPPCTTDVPLLVPHRVHREQLLVLPEVGAGLGLQGQEEQQLPPGLQDGGVPPRGASETRASCGVNVPYTHMCPLHVPQHRAREEAYVRMRTCRSLTHVPHHVYTVCVDIHGSGQGLRG